ncbi:hypothetical protein D5086_019687 [Populus alba]|uniref:Uncharacterized protein n=1 Tax=Populus alba TaxID=43335 RepID=A0ACC4BHY2_POPAL
MLNRFASCICREIGPSKPDFSAHFSTDVEEEGIDTTMHLVANHQIQRGKEKQKKEAGGSGEDMPSCLQLLGQRSDVQISTLNGAQMRLCPYFRVTAHFSATSIHRDSNKNVMAQDMDCGKARCFLPSHAHNA